MFSFGSSRKFSDEDKALYKELKEIFGFSPKNIALYKKALRHKSAISDSLEALSESNERLEFLGDAILDAAVAHVLYERFPDKDEGFLTKTRSKIVSRSSLNQLAKQLGIDKLVDSRLDMDNKNHSVNGNALEAIVGAIYMDMGYDFTKSLLENKVIREYIPIKDLVHQEKDHKSRLIEWSQKQKKTIRFRIEPSDSDAKHVKTYLAKVFLGRKIIGRGEGVSKKRAEQKAAQEAWGTILKD